MRRGNRRAFSLIEVVVAVTVLAGALFTLGVVIPRSVLHLRNKGYETVATQMAEDLLDATRGLDPAQVPNGEWLTSPWSGSGGVQKPVHPGSRRQFPPAPFPADGASAVMRRFEVNVDAMALDRFARFGEDDPAVKVPYYLDVEVGESHPGTPRTIVVTVWWRDKAGDPTSVDAKDFRHFTLSSKVGQ